MHSESGSVYFLFSKVSSGLNLEQPVSRAEDCLGRFQRTLTTECSLWFSYIVYLNLDINIFSGKII